jgi:hemoglobin-like flavoprotein
MAQAGRKAQVWWSKSREEPWRAQAASPRQSKSNPNFRGNRVDTIVRARLVPCSFFWIRVFEELVFRDAWQLAESIVDPIIAADMTTRTQLIQRSFELTAERCEDLTPLVYRRLFREHPEAEPMFRREANDLVKGSMLALTIDAIMDFAGDRTGSFRMIQCEVQSHDAYGTPRELFGKFFGVIAETMREILGAEWSPEIGEAWQQLLNEIDQFLSVPGSKPGMD